VFNIHCFIHCEALMMKTILNELKSVIDYYYLTFSIVFNYILYFNDLFLNCMGNIALGYRLYILSKK